MNDALGNTGVTVTYGASVLSTPADGARSIADLVADMKAGKVDALVILGGNPIFTAPADLDFPGALTKVATAVHVGLYQDETAARCQWHLPEAHYLESWGDGRAFDGTVSLTQPLIAPLYDGHQAIEVLATFNGTPGRHARGSREGLLGARVCRARRRRSGIVHRRRREAVQGRDRRVASRTPRRVLRDGRT